MAYLSDIELYYSPPGHNGKEITLTGDEYKHAFKVMRHRPGDELFVTNGNGEIFDCRIKLIEKDIILLSPEKIHIYKNEFENIFFCLPKLKNPERLEFALEKCTELGITNFFIFESERTISKSSRLERWNKIVLSAMKQSLRSFLPKISEIKSLSLLKDYNGEKIIFEQKAESYFANFKINSGKKYYFLFGPEGGFTDDELMLLGSVHIYKLAENRLRSETAIVKCASML